MIVAVLVTYFGISTDCGIGGLGGGDAVACPNNVCMGFSGSQIVYFEAFADGSSGYLPGTAPPGYSPLDMANALAIINAAANETSSEERKFVLRTQQDVRSLSRDKPPMSTICW